MGRAILSGSLGLTVAVVCLCQVAVVDGLYESRALWLVQDATSDEIRELFSQFGTVKSGNGAITLKHNGGNNSFAYVDFMDVASAQACVDAKDVMLKDSIVCTVECGLNIINCMPCCHTLALLQERTI